MQQDLLRTLDTGTLVRLPGGFWVVRSEATKVFEGTFNTQLVPAGVKWFGTRTVQAMTASGYLVRTYEEKDEWRDPRRAA